ncbi:MAG: ATP-dependent RNA helicase [Acidobacteriota bacterium]
MARTRAVVITAAPGAGKTTRVPPALLGPGPVIVLQPRRVAARSIARRIADERRWRVGEEVGWQVRFDRRFSERTRLLVVTEGILTARLQSDPLLTGFATIILDEFHERSIHADLALALARQAWLARADLRLVIMSATLDHEPLLNYLPGCAHIDVPGRTHAVEIEYSPALAPEIAAGEALVRTTGDILLFLPGAPEINRTLPIVAGRLGPTVEILPLHGSLRPDEQDRVFTPGPKRRVVLATNIAETSITVPRVTGVVDAGFQKVARYDPARGIDSLDLERVTQAAADQRAGRAGRMAPGLAFRLWDARDRLRTHREPDITRVDLAATVLEVFAWGGDPASLEWFEAPPPDSLEAATRLLERLGAIAKRRLTPLGRDLQRFPLHPRLARILLESGGSWAAAVACAVLSERSFAPPASVTTTSCDLLGAIDDSDHLPPHVLAVARQLHDLGSIQHGTPPKKRRTGTSEMQLRRAIFAGYPDRVAQRRSPGTPKLLLASGTGATLGRDSGVLDAQWLVALDIRSRPPQGGGRSADPEVRIASAIDREWLEPSAVAVEHRLDKSSGAVRAVESVKYDALVLSERPAAIDPVIAGTLIANTLIERGPSPDDERLLRRLAFAGRPLTFTELATRAASGLSRLQDVSLVDAIPGDVGRRLETLAPDRLHLPSGRTTKLEYRQDGTVAASVKLQELFGVAETPRVGPRREPVLLLLLAPNGRPVQTTRDLRSFWERTYPEVRRELAWRYPKHRWPEEPGA